MYLRAVSDLFLEFWYVRCILVNQEYFVKMAIC